MQASSTCNERLPLSVQIARHASRFVIIGIEAANQNFLPSMMCLAVEFPHYGLGHPYKTRRDRTGSELWPRRINNPKERNNNESTDSIQKTLNPATAHRIGADRRFVHACACGRKPRVRF